jgi:molecular chaperone GrpE (heat shock protein)
MKTKALSVLGVWIGLLTLISCTTTRTRTGEIVETKDSYSARAAEQLDQMQTEIDKLRSRTAEWPATRSAENLKAVTDLEGSMTTARTQLDELIASDNETWPSFRPRVEATMSEMRQSLDRYNVAE